MNKFEVYQIGERWAVHLGNPTGLGDTLHTSREEAENEAEWQKKLESERAARNERIEAEEKEKQEQERRMVESYQGFLDGSAMRGGKKRKTLERPMIHNGTKTTRKEVIESKIDSGWWIDGDRLTNGDWIYEPATKTELDYAAHLINL